MALTIHVGSSFPAEAERELSAGLAHHHVERPPAPSASNLVALEDETVMEAEVVFGQPSPSALARSPRVRWIHLTSAGYTRYAGAPIQRALRDAGVALTTSSTVYAEPCATHALALVLALLRQLPAAGENQRGVRGWPAAELRRQSRVLQGARVVLLGFGAIGQRLASLLSPFGAEVVALRSRPRGDDRVRTVGAADLDHELERADAVISSLPEAPTTIGLMSRARFDLLRSQAVFVNVGRGTTVDQAAMIDSLGSGKLGGVGLDVTDPEPLPPDNPLWTHPRVIITPHTAGGREDEHVRLVRHFLENLRRYERGEALVDRVI